MGGPSKSPGPVWQNHELRFDVAPAEFLPRLGEVEIDSINSVEDTKGNNGERGSLSITNLRLLWCSHKSTKVNLSVGLDTISKLKIRPVQSKLRGNTQALYVMAFFELVKYEFIFTSLVNASPRLFTTVMAVHRAYDTSKLYRELKLRGAIIRDQDLKTLPDEQVYERVSGVWNLSSDQGNLGTFFVTNIRLVWFANLANNFNVSIPYLQIESLRVKDSKFGVAIVVKTTKSQGGYVLGFRMDPPDRLQRTFEMINNLFELFVKNPNFGVRFSYDEAPRPLEQVTIRRVEEDAAIVEDYEDTFPVARGREAYVADDSGAASASAAAEAKEGSLGPVAVYNADLGCAVQPLPPGATAASLWTLVASSGPVTSS